MRWLYVSALVVALSANTASAGPILTNGTLSVEIRADSGAIHNAALGGVEFYRQGAFVSDFGFQNGTNTATFSINTTNGGSGTAVTVSPAGGTPSSVVVTGVYTGGGANIAFTRTYSLVPGQNVLRTTTTFTNNGANSTTLRTFDTADPDQGIPSTFSTDNDIYLLGGFNVGRATAASGVNSGYTVVFGPGGVLGFGNTFGLGISNGAQLNTFFTSPFDPNGANADIGFAFGRQLTLAPGASGTVDFLQAFGTTRPNAENAFLASQVVPEPTSMVVFGLMGVAGFGYVRRRLKGTPVA